ncbi:MAG: tetratricopeptide repeat protein, partial [Alphaproteobacteria bacterium]
AYGMYDKAITAINRGLGKAASLKTPDEGRVSLGWVYFLAGKYDDAKTAFESVKTDPRSMDLAKAWLILIKNKTNPPAPPKQ